MGLQKYHTFGNAPPEPRDNGAICIYGSTMWGRHLAKIQNCPIDCDVMPIPPRMVYITGEPCTYFSQPAATQYKGKTLRGFITFEDSGPVFRVYTACAEKLLAA